MNWKQHLAFGILIEVIFLIFIQLQFNWFNYTIENILILLMLLFISPQVCDLDHRHSKLREVMTYIGLIIGLIGVTGYYFKLDLIMLMVIGIITSSVAYLTKYITKHRGITHSILFCVLYGSILYLFFTDIMISIFGIIGAYTHLIADGIPFRIITKFKY